MTSDFTNPDRVPNDDYRTTHSSDNTNDSTYNTPDDSDMKNDIAKENDLELGKK